MKADASIYLPDPKEVAVDAGADSSDGDELATPPPKATKADDKARRDGAPRVGDLPKICYLDPDSRRSKLLAKKQPKFDPRPDKDGAMDALCACSPSRLADVAALCASLDLCATLVCWP